MAYVTDLSMFFTSVYANVAQYRAVLNLPPLVPNSLPAFQIGAEFAPQAQVAPRIVIIPTGVSRYDYSQQMPTTQTPTNLGRSPYKSTHRRWLTFDAQIWGDPDLTTRDVSNPANTTAPGVPDPVMGFNATIELEREFIVAISSLIGNAGQAWAPLNAQYTTANAANNRYGRLLVLSFEVATPVTMAPYKLLPYSTTQGDGGVVREIDASISINGVVTSEPKFDIPP